MAYRKGQRYLLRVVDHDTGRQVWAGVGANADTLRAFFAKLVPNVRKLGLLDANNGYLRQLWGEAGLLEFEFADDTSEDYAQYDAVAQDRATSSETAPA